MYLPTDPKPRFTDDGFEMSLGVNHLGHFLLVQVALPQAPPLPPAPVASPQPSLSPASAWPSPRRRASPPHAASHCSRSCFCRSCSVPRTRAAASSARYAAIRIRLPVSLCMCRVHVSAACMSAYVHACMATPCRRCVHPCLHRAYAVQVTGNKNTVAGSLVKPVADVGNLEGLANGAGEVMVDGAKKFDGAKAYKDAKALNMMTVLELHRRLGKKTGTTYNSM